ncbi:MAG: WG repeat-containing protein [Planctomycetes bacterium]|nr:WG repeat-containing protein [Planctomycetota bacterium]
MRRPSGLTLLAGLFAGSLSACLTLVPIRARAAEPPRAFYSYDVGKWGFRDARGGFVVPPTYDDAQRFSHGLAPVNAGADMDVSGVMFGGKWGFIDTSGAVVIPLTFEYAYGFSDGVAKVRDANGARFIDTKGNTVLDMGEHWNCGEYSEGLLPVRIDRSLQGGDAETRYIDKEGQTVLTVEGYAEEFHRGLAAVSLRSQPDADRVCGFINRQGILAIEPAYADLLPFSEGLAAVAIARDSQTEDWGYIDRTGQYVIEPRFNEVESFEDGVAKVHVGGEREIVCDGPVYWSGGEWQWIDSTGNVLRRMQRWDDGDDHGDIVRTYTAAPKVVVMDGVSLVIVLITGMTAGAVLGRSKTRLRWALVEAGLFVAAAGVCAVLFWYYAVVRGSWGEWAPYAALVCGFSGALGASWRRSRRRGARWFQIPLIVVLLASALVAVFSAWATHPLRQELQRRKIAEAALTLERSGHVTWYATAEGEEFWHVRLAFWRHRITDAELEELIAPLSRFPVLHLDVHDNDITDAGLLHLKGLGNLARVRVAGTRVTAPGIAELQQHLPHVVVDRKWTDTWPP